MKEKLKTKLMIVDRTVTKMFIFVLLLCLATTMLKAQDTLVGHSSVELKFSNYATDEDTTKVFCFYKYCCHVTQIVTIESHQSDSVKLDLEVCHYHPLFLKFFYNNMEVCGTDNGNNVPLQFTLSKAGIAIDCEGYDSITLSYYFNPSFALYGNVLVEDALVFYQSGWHSIFFTSPNVKIDEITLVCPDDIWMFVDKKYEHENNRYLLQPSDNSHLNVFLMNSAYFVVDTLCDNPEITTYMFKGSRGWQDTIHGDWHDIEPDEESHPESRLPSNVTSVIDNLSNFFHKSIKSLKYIDTYTDVSDRDDKACWGQSYKIDDENRFIIMDTSFWNNYLWCHETTHCFNTKLPCSNDSSCIFFNESITEFVSVYLGTQNKNDIDSVFIKRVEKYGKTPNDFQSVFQVDKNILGIDGSGSFNVVYVKTPYCLHLLAKDVGEQRFLKICSGFYKHVNKMETYTFADFEKYLLKHGVSRKQWKQFMTNMYSKDFGQ